MTARQALQRWRQSPYTEELKAEHYEATGSGVAPGCHHDDKCRVDYSGPSLPGEVVYCRAQLFVTSRPSRSPVPLQLKTEQIDSCQKWGHFPGRGMARGGRTKCTGELRRRSILCVLLVLVLSVSCTAGPSHTQVGREEITVLMGSDAQIQVRKSCNAT